MRRHAALAAALFMVAAPPILSAQSLQYTSVTKTELGGALGRIMSMMSGVGDETQTTTYIEGSRIRTDEQKTSDIVDAKAGTMTMLDHESRTYTVIDFAKMAEQMAGAMSDASKQASTQMATETPTGQAAEQPQIEWEVHFHTDKTGKKEKIAGYDAEEVVLVTEVIAKNVPKEGEEQEQAGMAIVSDLWMSQDFPEYMLTQQMRSDVAEHIGESTRQSMANSMQAFSSAEPGLSEAWKKNAEELEKVQGYAMRTTMLFVALPPNVPLDRDEALAEKDKSLGSSAAGAAEGSAADVARKALGGIFGKKKEEPKAEAAEATPHQATFMRITTEIQNVKTGGIDPSVFEVPAGYTERPMGGPVGG